MASAPKCHFAFYEFGRWSDVDEGRTEHQMFAPRVAKTQAEDRTLSRAVVDMFDNIRAREPDRDLFADTTRNRPLKNTGRRIVIPQRIDRRAGA